MEVGRFIAASTPTVLYVIRSTPREVPPPPESGVMPVPKVKRWERLHGEVLGVFRDAGAKVWGDDEMVSARKERRVK